MRTVQGCRARCNQAIAYSLRSRLPAGLAHSSSGLSVEQELYEPLWEEIHARSKASGFRIRSIWMADVAQEGESSVINEDSLGNDRTRHSLRKFYEILTMPQQAGSTTLETSSTWSTSSAPRCPGPLSASATVWVAHTCQYSAPEIVALISHRDRTNSNL